MQDPLRHRKSSAVLRFVRPDGTPARGARVEAIHVRHEFLFGFGAFDAIDAASGQLDGETQAFIENRLGKMLGLFNYGTLPFYWGRFEKEEGKPETEALLRGARWLRERGVLPKGHPLCWHTVCAPWLLQYSNDEILERQLARIRREVTDFRGVIDTWDVINEVVIMPVFDRYDNAVTRLAKEHGQVGLVKRVFDEARASNPDAVLILNDFNTSPAYERLIGECLDAGVPVDVIGIQSHQHQGYWGRDKLLDVLDRFSRFGLPIHFTENTLVSGDLMPKHIEDLNDWQVQDWPSTLEGEERQKRETAEMYGILFRHPLVQAVTVWDAVDGKWLNAPSGLLRRDNSEKPAFDMLKRLIWEDWSTHAFLTTDDEGRARLEGIRGGYEVNCEGRTTPFTLAEGTPETVITI
ncbi:MAG TPA: endo-1,4-beta-xylanase [Candidatus Limnocylindria bacterium]|nr:endo-1,4-beta-xylanase [Candidatus Limnocylindria bacterium]